MQITATRRAAPFRLDSRPPLPLLGRPPTLALREELDDGADVRLGHLHDRLLERLQRAPVLLLRDDLRCARGGRGAEQRGGVLSGEHVVGVSTAQPHNPGRAAPKTAALCAPSFPTSPPPPPPLPPPARALGGEISNSKPSRRMFSIRMPRCSMPRPLTMNESAVSPGSTRSARLRSSSRSRRSCGGGRTVAVRGGGAVATVAQGWARV
jgi:hypothetical protein